MKCIFCRKDQYLNELKSIVGSEGFSAIIEMLANKNLQSDLELVAKGGRIVVS